MERISPEALMPHLEAALMMAPPETLRALQHPDRHRRLRAIARLADYLTLRLQCFDIGLADGNALRRIDDGQPHLMDCA